MNKFSECGGWKLSNCCDSVFWNESDVCNACLEHAVVACEDCEEFIICDNDNKPLIQIN